MVIYEIVKGALEAGASFLGWRGAPVVALALLAVGLWYSRELSGILIGIARWLRIGGVVVAGLAGLAVVGLATGWLSLDSGIVPALLELLAELAEKFKP